MKLQRYLGAIPSPKYTKVTFVVKCTFRITITFTIVRKLLDCKSRFSGDVNGPVDAVVVGSNPSDLEVGALGSEDEAEAQDCQSSHVDEVNHFDRIRISVNDDALRSDVFKPTFEKATLDKPTFLNRRF